MVELRVDFLFLVLLASNRQLQLAQSLAPEEQVDQDVVVLGVHPVLDLDNLEEPSVQFLYFVEDSQDVDELILVACDLRPHQVSDFQGDQVDCLQVVPCLVGLFLLVLDVLECGKDLVGCCQGHTQD